MQDFQIVWKISGQYGKCLKLSNGKYTVVFIIWSLSMIHVTLWEKRHLIPFILKWNKNKSTLNDCLKNIFYSLFVAKYQFMAFLLSMNPWHHIFFIRKVFVYQNLLAGKFLVLLPLNIFHPLHCVCLTVSRSRERTITLTEGVHHTGSRRHIALIDVDKQCFNREEQGAQRRQMSWSYGLCRIMSQQNRFGD